MIDSRFSCAMLLRMSDFGVEPVFMGIDPGLSGFVATISVDGKRVVATASLPLQESVNAKSRLDPAALYALVQTASSTAVSCVIEQQQVHARQGSRSGFTTGYNFGLLQMAAIASKNETAVTVVSPAKWKRHFGLLEHEGSKEERRAAAKSHAIETVEQLFPGIDLRASIRSRTLSHDKAEAILLALYAKSIYENEKKQ